MNITIHFNLDPEDIIRKSNLKFENRFRAMENYAKDKNIALDNMILEKNKSTPKIIGLLDWELSTLSPPFIDLSYWALMLRFEKTWPIGGLSNLNNENIYPGIPTEEEILESYLNLTKFDQPKYWKFLLAFNCCRFAGILQGIAKRVIDGNNSGKNAHEVGEQADLVADLGSKILKEYL